MQGCGHRGYEVDDADPPPPVPNNNNTQNRTHPFHFPLSVGAGTRLCLRPNEMIADGLCVHEVHSPYRRRFANRSCRRRRCWYRRLRDCSYGRRCVTVTIVRRRPRHLGLGLISSVSCPRSGRCVCQHARGWVDRRAFLSCRLWCHDLRR